jgi:3',5'-cyclic AMP phosphodiesterase CpdA
VTLFIPSGAYQPDLDIRFAAGLRPGWAQPLVEARPPNAETWLVVMSRRAGKSWLAAAIARARPDGRTQRVDLRDSAAAVKKAGLGCLRGANMPPAVSGDVLLVDEPGLTAADQDGRRPRDLATGLAKVRESGVVPVVFATPLDHALLMPHLGADAVKDVLLPPILNNDEIARMTARAPGWGQKVADQVRTADPAWLQTPFLLELVLHVAEDQLQLRDDTAALLRAAIDEAASRHAYLHQVVGNGLTADQRAELRADRWRTAGVTISCPRSADLLSRTHLTDDPMLTNHLPDVLRIHHISDLHHGGELRANVDEKDKTRAGRSLAKLAGAGSPLDSYLAHVRHLDAEGRAPHLVIVTGDLVNRPDDRHGKQALAWLAQLKALLAPHHDLGPADPRIVLVGGNHDVSWDLCLEQEREARHRWFADTFADYPHPDLQLADCARRRVFLKYPEAGLRLALLGSAESGGEPARDQDRTALDEALHWFQDAEDGLAIRDVILTFERLDPGVIARGILDRLTREPGYVTMAALHHPLSPVPSVEVAPYAGIINAGQAKRALISAETALVLHGHTHLGFLAAERLFGAERSWTIRIAGAATLASAASDEQNGYNEVFIAREGARHRVAIRPVRLDGGQWMPHPGVAFQPGAPDECALVDLIQDSN